MSKDYRRYYKDDEEFEVSFYLSRYSNGFDDVSDEEWDNIIEMVSTDYCCNDDMFTQFLIKQIRKDNYRWEVEQED